MESKSGKVGSCGEVVSLIKLHSSIQSLLLVVKTIKCFFDHQKSLTSRRNWRWIGTTTFLSFTLTRHGGASFNLVHSSCLLTTSTHHLTQITSSLTPQLPSIHPRQGRVGQSHFDSHKVWKCIDCKWVFSVMPKWFRTGYLSCKMSCENL